MATTGTKKTTGAAGKALEGETSQAAGAATDATNTAAAAPLVGASVTADQAGQAANTSGSLPVVEGSGGTESALQSGQPSDAEIAQLGAALAETVLDNSSAIQPLGLFQHFDVRVLAPVTIRDVRYQPNTVLEGLPLALVEAHLGSVDPHPEAVAYARANGGEVIEFQGLDQDEHQE